MSKVCKPVIEQDRKAYDYEQLKTTGVMGLGAGTDDFRQPFGFAVFFETQSSGAFKALVVPQWYINSGLQNVPQSLCYRGSSWVKNENVSTNELSEEKTYAIHP